MLRFYFLALAGCFALLWPQHTYAQQNLRGTILDRDSQMPLQGASVAVFDTALITGTTTDEQGYFKLESLPLGRLHVEVSYLGYEPQRLSSLLLTSGKELVLHIELQESALAIDEVVVTADHHKTRPLNEMAVVSARSFSVEETSRYAASYFDPARMAQNFAGVNTGSGGFDLDNEIIVRGNSPSGILWRLEGIEIPNPNHFASLGNSGGAISMLSSSTLANSDFYTGAFPAEYGNALSGVFDLNLRPGNNERYEFAAMVGVLGLEAAVEGPFYKGSKGSFLVNYRYSTLAALNAVGLSPTGDVIPEYQDLSFKVNLPTTTAGTFSLWGLGGANKAYFEPEKDHADWDGKYDNWGFEERQKVGTVGLTHKLLLTDRSYLKTTVAVSGNQGEFEEYSLDSTHYLPRTEDMTRYTEYALRGTVLYHHKLNARNSLRTGLVLSHLGFDFTYDEKDNDALERFFDNEGSTQLLQAYAQWKWRPSTDWTVLGGLHYTQLLLNNSYSVEPRLAVQWQAAPKHGVSGSVGLHSRMEHLAVYLFDGEFPDGTVHPSGKHLGLTKSMHAVLGYEFRISPDLRLMAEAYYQHLFDIPVENIPGSTRSILNAKDVWEVIGAEEVVNAGLGRNYGLDLTLEKFFARDYYFMLTGSIYDSKYRPIDDKWYDTRFNGHYNLNLIAGKEFRVGREKKNRIGVNGKYVLSGGSRYTPVDLQASRMEGEAVYLEDMPFSALSGTYYRFDVGFSYRINGKRVSHAIMLDIQNVTNRENVYLKYYDEDSGNLDTWTQSGLLPILNYRLEF